MFRFPYFFRLAAVALTLSLSAARAVAADDDSPLLPAPTPIESFDVGTLHVDQFGSGSQSLVLIPGLGCGPWVWHGTIARFSPKYTVYVITLPGFSGHAATKEKLLFPTFKRDFWEMLEARKIVKPVVIGHSLGGTLAIALAAEHPERLSAIVAADGLPVFPMLANAPVETRKAMADEMAKQIASSTEAEALAAQKSYMSTIGTNRPELIDAVAALSVRSDPKAVAAWMHELLVTDLRPDLGRVTIPFLEIMPYQPPAEGQSSAYTEAQTLAFYKSLVAGAPKVTVIAVAPSRHFVMLDQPEPFHEAVAQFLASTWPSD